MKTIIFTVCALTTLSTSAFAQLLITEIQSNQNAPGTNDYWELTNFGPSSIDLDGWRWNDDQATFDGTKSRPISGVVIGSGETIVFSNIAAVNFRSWWGIDESIQVIGDTGAPGLGQNDAVFLFNSGGDLVTSLSYAAGDFTRADGSPSTGGHAGLSAGGQFNYQAMVWVPASGIVNPRYTFAVAGELGVFQAATGLDLGSPGVIPEPSTWGLLAGLAVLAGVIARRRSRVA